MIKGSHHKESAKEKLRVFRLGKKQSKETILKRVESRKGYRHSLETIEKMRMARLKNPICYWKNKKLSDEIKRKISLKQKGIKETPEAINKTHAWHKDTIKRQDANKKLVISHLGKKLSVEQKRKIGLASKLNWQREEYRNKVIGKVLKSLLKKPTKLEQKLINLINKHNLPYKYVGNGSFIMGRKNPDFINVNGQKICIEIRAKGICLPFDKITPDEYEKRQINHYQKYGWKCLVLFDDKIKDDVYILQRLKEIETMP